MSIFDANLVRGTETVGERLRTVDMSIVGEDAIVLRESNPVMHRLVEIDAYLSTKLKGRRVLVISRSAEPHGRKLSITIPTWAMAMEPTQDEWAAIQEAELHTLLWNAGAIIDAPDHHFVLPSGVHADKFARIARLAADPLSAERVADWFLDRLSPETVVVCDTGALAIVANSAASFVNSRFGWSVAVDSLNQYPLSSNEVSRAIEDARERPIESTDQLLSRPSGERPILFLLSANSTGASLEKFERSKRNRDEIVVILNTSQEPPVETVGLTILCRDPLVQTTPDSDDVCGNACPTGRIVIDPRTYEMNPTEAINPISVNLIGIDPWWARFWQAVSDRDALRIHRNDVAIHGRRHRALWFDVDRLINDPFITTQWAIKWAASLRSMSRRDEQTDLLAGVWTLTVPSVPWNSLKGAAADRPAIEATEIVTLSNVSLASISAWFASLPSEAVVEGIVFLLPVVRTGQSVRALREHAQILLEDRFHRSVPIIVLPLLHLSESPFDTDALSLRYRDSHGNEGFQPVFTVPVLGGSACPWCAEADLLRRIASRGDKLLGPSQLEVIARRQRELDNELDHAAVGSWHLTLPETAPDHVTFDSIFGDLYPLAAMGAAICTTLLKTRVAPLRRHRSAVPSVVRLSTPISAYFDRVFLIGILRAITAGNSKYGPFDAEVRRGIRDWLEGGTLTDRSRWELALAAALGKIPQELSSQDVGTGSELDELASALLAST
jgi:hypothetical protein